MVLSDKTLDRLSEFNRRAGQRHTRSIQRRWDGSSEEEQLQCAEDHGLELIEMQRVVEGMSNLSPQDLLDRSEAVRRTAALQARGTTND